ncbi:MAG: AAA family ATPase, partial [Gammaproteobacteria bacterium]
MMRIHRIRIANVAGVALREVTLADQGITLIAGQNESGKSTLFLALHALLEHPDDASHREVKALRPLHTGLTPQVEADITIGPYRLTYAKSFAKGKAGGTTLRIDQPVAESLA